MAAVAGDDLPTDYDVIVLGTGLTESIIAAACSRIGLNVLHLDRNDHYSSDWATFNMNGLTEWVQNHQNCDASSVEELSAEDLSEHMREGEKSVKLIKKSNTVSNVEEKWYIEDGVCEDKVPDPKPVVIPNQVDEAENADTEVAGTSNVESIDQCQGDEHESDKTEDVEKTEESKDENQEDNSENMMVEETDEKSGEVEVKKIEEDTNKWTIARIKKQWRKFNVDLTPKILYCRGGLVELLISSDIAKYCEFKTVSRVLTLMNEKLEPVPCSRADVFSSKAVSMIEKRMLMKLLTFCLSYDLQPAEYAGFEDRPFSEFLKSKKLTPNIHHYVMHSIAMATEETNTIDGLKATQNFLKSLGRYGNTAFLWPLYGSGELPQAFCRMCAVFGGTYCLRRTASCAIMDTNNKCVGIVSEGKRLKCDWLVMEASYAGDFLGPNFAPRNVSRAIFFTDRSIHPCTSDEITLLSLPPNGNLRERVTVIELSPTSYACPEGVYIIHATTSGTEDAKADLEFLEQLFLLQQGDNDDNDPENPKPKLLWSLYYNLLDASQCEIPRNTEEHVLVVSGPDSTIGYEHAVKEAREVFETICPNDDFCPRAPNPEDLIFDDNSQPPGNGFAPVEEEGTSTVDIQRRERPPTTSDVTTADTDAVQPGPSNAPSASIVQQQPSTDAPSAAVEAPNAEANSSTVENMETNSETGEPQA